MKMKHISIKMDPEDKGVESPLKTTIENRELKNSSWNFVSVK